MTLTLALQRRRYQPEPGMTPRRNIRLKSSPYAKLSKVRSALDGRP